MEIEMLDAKTGDGDQGSCESCKRETHELHKIINYKAEVKLICSDCLDLIQWYDNGNS